MIEIQDTIYMGTAAPASGGGGSGDAVWGSITGTLSNQTDLQTALNAKQDTLTAGSNITITNNVISATGGGTVDQTYNASSANAQSGVAIAGAGFLKNQSTGSDALAIGENTANEIGGTLAIGNNATVSNLSTAVAIGNSSSSSGGIAIGNETHAGANDVIIGNSVLSSAIPDRVGANPVFAVVDLYNSSDHAGFALVDLMTGKIPDNRISSNIARVSDIPSVNNPAITFKQGGTTKGTITLNQSSAQTITFDAGGGGSVDQTYNASSTNAQSGVAIAGAGFLRNQAAITSTIAIGNTNTTPNSVLIGNNMNIESGGSIDVLGKFVTVDTGSNDSNDVVIGSGCNVTGSDCVVVGQNITASTNKDILLGYNYNSSYIIDRTSTNPVLAVTNTASTDYEGYALVDLQTGKIPNNRINVDANPTQNSTNFVTSGTIYTVLGNINTLLSQI